MAKSVHVLVVNHQEAFLRLMDVILRDAGYESTGCPAGERALEVAGKLQPAVIVVDTWLQNRDEGWELLQLLRLDEATRHIPIILTSSDAERVQERAHEISGLKNVLIVPKPFDPETLLRAVDRVTNPDQNWNEEAQAALDVPPEEPMPRQAGGDA